MQHPGTFVGNLFVLPCSNAGIHTLARSRADRAYLVAWVHRVKRRYLPTYSPDTNPVERVWGSPRRLTIPAHRPDGLRHIILSPRPGATGFQPPWGVARKEGVNGSAQVPRLAGGLRVAAAGSGDGVTPRPARTI